MELMDQHGRHLPRDELQQITEVLERVLKAEGHENVRDVVGDVDAFQEAVEEVEAYVRFRPNCFDRRTVNRRLRQCADGSEEWRWE